MKKAIILILLCVASVTVFAKNQSGEEIQTLFSGNELRSGGYAAPELRYSQFGDDWGLMLGGRAGWIINSTFSLGLAGYGLVDSPEAYKITVNNLDTSYYTRTGWGGLFLEYTYASNSLIHFTVNSFFGWGGVTYTPEFQKMDNNENKDNWNYPSTSFFLIEPGATAEINIAKFFRVAVGASYKIATGVNLDIRNNDVLIKEVRNKDLSGLSANLTLKFGWF